METRALVTNAANRDQVKDAGRREKRRAEQRRGLIAKQLSTYEGRQFVWEELTRHRLFESITVQSSMIYALSGRRDAGLELLAEVQGSAEHYLLMQNEAIARQAREDRETDAQHTPRAEPGASNA